MPVKLNDVIEALDTAAEACGHYLDRRTGEIVMVTNEETLVSYLSARNAQDVFDEFLYFVSEREMDLVPHS